MYEVASWLAWLCGWTYFTAWTASFYPQVWMNHKRKSTKGLSHDFALLNVLGFFCYSVYTCIKYIQQLKADLPQAVEVQDVAFAVHSFLISCVTIGQVFVYNSTGRWPFSSACSMAVGTILMCLIGHIVLAATGIIKLTAAVGPNGSIRDMSWTVTSFAAVVKISITATKYLPQIILNFKRRTTHGMSVWGFNLDLCGGLLSLSQNAIDAISTNDWGYIFNNWTKPAISAVSLTYDGIILVQHYIIYRSDRSEMYKDVEERLPRHSKEEVFLTPILKDPLDEVITTQSTISAISVESGEIR